MEPLRSWKAYEGSYVQAPQMEVVRISEGAHIQKNNKFEPIS